MCVLRYKYNWQDSDLMYGIYACLEIGNLPLQTKFEHMESL